MGIETPVCQLFECPRIQNWKWTPMPTGIRQAIDHLPSITSDIHWNRAFVLIPSPRLSVSTAMESCIHPHPVPSPLCQHRPSISTLALQLPLLVAPPPLHLPTPDSPSSSNTPEWEKKAARRTVLPLPMEPVHLRHAVNPFTSVSELCVFSPFLWNHAPPLACHTAAPPPPSTGGPSAVSLAPLRQRTPACPPPPPVLWIRKGHVDPRGATLLSHVRQ